MVPGGVGIQMYTCVWTRGSHLAARRVVHAQMLSLSRYAAYNHKQVLWAQLRPRGRSTLRSHRAMSSLTDPPADDGPQSAAKPFDPVVQYIVLRQDLWREQQWPLGSVVAQACHASTAALWTFKDDECTAAYCAPENIDHMHKVVLEVKGEVQLTNLAAKLVQAGVQHKVWVEQPENFPTCLATKPYTKSEVSQHFKKLNLCKAVPQ